MFFLSLKFSFWLLFPSLTATQYRKFIEGEVKRERMKQRVNERRILRQGQSLDSYHPTASYLGAVGVNNKKR